MDGTTIVTVGIDTHTDVHVAAVLDQMGRLLATASFAATTRGYAQLATWAESFGEVDKVGMEGTGCFGAGLLRFLADYGLAVIEVDRPDRSERRRNGKSDPLDAESAARAVQAGRACGTPKSRDAQAEMIRVLRVARRGAMKARVQAGAQIDAVIVAAPEQVRGPLRKLAPRQRIRACAALRPGPLHDPGNAIKAALRSLARRWQALQAEIDDLDAAPLDGNRNIGTRVTSYLSSEIHVSEANILTRKQGGRTLPPRGQAAPHLGGKPHERHTCHPPPRPRLRRLAQGL
jgi:transposase